MTRKSELSEADFFEDPARVEEYISQQFAKGSLVIVLGAGVSASFGVPEWNRLLSDVIARATTVWPEDKGAPLSAEDTAEWLLANTFGHDEVTFKKAVKDALYDTLPPNPDSLLDASALLRALGDTMRGSTLARVRDVITFNFDDLLERSLRRHGAHVESIASVPAWETTAQVRVYHPHGLLPLGITDDTSIVMAQIHYDRIVGRNTEAWRSVLLHVLRSSTAVFIGLSGRDQNLASLLAEVNDVHVGRRRGDLYWGFRLARADDAMRFKWQRRGVWQIDIADYAEIPEWLLRLCQRPTRDMLRRQ